MGANYEGQDRVATVGPSTTGVLDAYLFDGIDHPLRIKRGSAVVYYELDLAGNVRGLRLSGGSDLGGYRYTAFGKTVADTSTFVQPLRWKGRWWQSLGGREVYDVRARQWSPELGVFLSIDGYEFHGGAETLWAWPHQSPARMSDPLGHEGESCIYVPCSQTACYAGCMKLAQEKYYRCIKMPDSWDFCASVRNLEEARCSDMCKACEGP